MQRLSTFKSKRAAVCRPQMSGERPHVTPDNIEATPAVSHFCCGMFIVRVLNHLVSNPLEANTFTREAVGAACSVG